MELPNYLICDMPEGVNGIGLILATHGNNQIGRIAQFKTEDELLDFQLRTSAMFAKMEGYRIVIIEYGYLNQFFNPQDTIGKLAKKVILEEMADFYKQTKIEKNAGYYKRYKQEG